MRPELPPALPEPPPSGPTVQLANGVVGLQGKVVGKLDADLEARFGTSDVEWPYLFVPLEARIRSNFAPGQLERCRLELPKTARVLAARRLLRTMTAAGCESIEVASGATTAPIAFGAPSGADRPIKLLHAHFRAGSVVISRVAAVHQGGRDEYEVATVFSDPRREPLQVVSAVRTACRSENVMCARVVVEARPKDPFHLVALTVAAMRAQSVAPTKLSFVEPGPDSETNLAIIPRQTEGYLPRAAIQSILSRHRKRLQACYKTQPNGAPRLVVTRFSILRTGAVSDVQVIDPSLAASIAPRYLVDSAGLGDQNLAAPLDDANSLKCLRETYAALKFPEPEDGVRVVVHALLLGRAPARPRSKEPGRR